jgi:O-antigen biosynthesis protein WbqP
VLYNHHDVLAARTARGVHRLVPGITGFAQINGRDAISTRQKAAYDAYYLRRRSLGFDLLIAWVTIWKVLSAEGACEGEMGQTTLATPASPPTPARRDAA